MSLKEPIKVRILDHEYMIRSDETPDYVESVARFVNDKFKEVLSNTEGLPEKKAAILAAFHIASDYFQVLREKEALVEDVEQRAKALVHRIQSQVEEPTHRGNE